MLALAVLAELLQDALEDNSGAEEVLQIRGFRTHKQHGLAIQVTEGHVVVDAEHNDDATLTYGPQESRSDYTPLFGRL